jgi:hypothetical protein
MAKKRLAASGIQYVVVITNLTTGDTPQSPQPVSGFVRPYGTNVNVELTDGTGVSLNVVTVPSNASTGLWNTKVSYTGTFATMVVIAQNGSASDVMDCVRLGPSVSPPKKPKVNKRKTAAQQR